MQLDPQNPIFQPFPPLPMESRVKLRAQEISLDYARELIFIFEEDTQVIHTFNKQLQHLHQFRLSFYVESMTTAPNSDLLFVKCTLSGSVYIQVIDMFSGSVVTRWEFSSYLVSLACDAALSLYTCDYLNSQIRVFDVLQPVSVFSLSPIKLHLTPLSIKLGTDMMSLLVQNLEPEYFLQVYDLCGNLLKYFSNTSGSFVGDSFAAANLSCVVVCMAKQHELHILNKHSDKVLTLGGFGNTIGHFIRPFAVAFLPPDLVIICNESHSFPIQCLSFKPF